MACSPNDWIAESPASIAARLDGAKTSQLQAKRTIGVMAIVSTMMLIAAYNAYFSYDYRYMTANFQRRLDRNTVSDVLMTQAARDWTMSRTISIDLFGIRLSVDDAAVLGTAALAVLSLWLILAKRRENHTIGFLLRNTDSEKPSAAGPESSTNSERWQIFHSIAANAQFETADASFASIDSLEGHNPLKAQERGWLNRHAFGFVRGFFFGFPVLAALVVFGVDRYSYFLRDPFDAAGEVPGLVDPSFWPSAFLWALAFVPLAAGCWKAHRYARASENLLREYKGKLLRDLESKR